jgi:hypothetical protein
LMEPWLDHWVEFLSSSVGEPLASILLNIKQLSYIRQLQRGLSAVKSHVTQDICYCQLTPRENPSLGHPDQSRLIQGLSARSRGVVSPSVQALVFPSFLCD